MAVDVSGITGRKAPRDMSPKDALWDGTRRLYGLQHMMRFAPKDVAEFNDRLAAIAHELSQLQIPMEARQETGGSDRMERGGTNRGAEEKLGAQGADTSEVREGE